MLLPLIRKSPFANARSALPILLLLAFLAGPASVRGEKAPTEEDKQISILQSSAPLHEKDAACVQLKKIGTPKCIPAVAALLTDQQLSHSARLILEPMSSRKAGQALIKALDQTTGNIRIGIIGSLGMRHEKTATSALVKLVSDRDLPTAQAAVAALGRIDSGLAARTVRKALAADRPELRDVALDACLEMAARDVDSGHEDNAKSMYSAILKVNSSRRGQTAAYAGFLRASGKAGVDAAIAALRGNEELKQLAALSVMPEMNAAGATKSFADALPMFVPSVQVGVLQALGQRADPAAAPRVAQLVSSPSPEVRLAALTALGNVGGPAQVRLLAGNAAALRGPSQAAARAALVDLRHGDVHEELLAALQNGEVAAQAEIARALGERRERSAVPQLLKVAQNGSDSAKRAALLALPPLVDEKDLPAMVKLVAGASSESLRLAAAGALNAAYQNLQMRNGKVAAGALIAGIKNGSKELQIALLPVCSGLTNAEVRQILRDSIKASDPALHSAAVLALCDTADPQLVPDVTTVACEETEPKLRTPAVQAVVRLTTQEEGVKLSAAEKLSVLKKVASSSPDPAQTKTLLAGLAEVPTAGSFDLARQYLSQSEFRTEAEQACVKIAGRLTGPDAKTVLPELKELAASATSPDLAKKAKEIIDGIQSAADYITTWEIAGPFQQKGKDYSVLFDIPFAPEKSIKPVKVNWKPMPPASTDRPPYIMDLLKAIGGEQRAAYARTMIESPVEQKVRLEMGSDDGLKVWLNDEQVLANNIARPLTPGSDKVNVTLRKGRNDLLLKITQNNQGWEFCARLVNTNGEHLDGLKIAVASDLRTAAK